MFKILALFPAYPLLINSCFDFSWIKRSREEVLLWLRGLRIWSCHYSGSGPCCGEGSVPDTGTFTCCGLSNPPPPKKKIQWVLQRPSCWSHVVTAMAQVWSLAPGTSACSRQNQKRKNIQIISSQESTWAKSSHCGLAVTNLSLHDDVGSIAGLAQWIKDLALLWAVV